MVSLPKTQFPWDHCGAAATRIEIFVLCPTLSCN